MGIEIDLGIHQGAGQFLSTVGGASFGQFVSEVFGVVVGQLHLNHPHQWFEKNFPDQPKGSWRGY